MKKISFLLLTEGVMSFLTNVLWAGSVNEELSKLEEKFFHLRGEKLSSLFPTFRNQPWLQKIEKDYFRSVLRLFQDHKEHEATIYLLVLKYYILLLYQKGALDLNQDQKLTLAFAWREAHGITIGKPASLGIDTRLDEKKKETLLFTLQKRISLQSGLEDLFSIWYELIGFEIENSNTYLKLIQEVIKKKKMEQNRSYWGKIGDFISNLIPGRPDYALFLEASFHS